ncbi:RusA family crossover junction endodeoxyribonuclease [Clostridium sp. YIM B02551]|uniref:RusA family crossover junction endodeoxyribonuclease n=1 Tax=Clostridium sp. YIM B02551 TaxID=2910679 RepID=UPI001EEAE5A2|nr:RusA family crossover junction endodeoxyribonuclease [Clostridium sp. YIM B02551]
MFVLTIPGEPKGKGRPRLGKNVTYTPKDTVEYENLVKLCFYQSEYKKLEGEIKATIKAYYSIPKSASKKNRSLMEQNLIRPTKKPDLDNVAKIILDSLNKLAYDDDSQVVVLVIEKFYSDNPRVVVSLDAL